MSFGGAVQAMVTTMKNNRNLLSKRKSLKDNMGGFGGGKQSVEFKTPNASAYELKKLKTELQQENKIVKRKQLLLLTVFLIVLISVLYYYA